MVKSRWTVALVGCCAMPAALGAAGEQLSVQADKGGPVRAGGNFIPSNSVALPVNCPTDNFRPRTTVRVRIKRGFSVAADADGAVRQVFYKNYKLTEDPQEPDDDAIAHEDPNTGSDLEFASNPFHIDVSTLQRADPGWIRVKVILRNEKFMFDRIKPTTGAVIVGVSRDSTDGTTADWFCQMPDVAPPSP